MRTAIGLGLLVLGLLAGFLYALPPYLIPGPPTATPDYEQLLTDRLKARNDIRVVIVQMFGIPLLLLGAIATWRQLQQNSRQQEAARLEFQQQLELNRRGHLAERFSKAIELLGEPALDVRIGGIYVLASIMNQSSEYRPAAVEILTSYVRSRSPWPGAEPINTAGQPADKSNSQRGEPDDLDNPSSRLRARKPDVQAVLDVLTTTPIQMTRAVNLNATDLRRAHLENAHLAGFTLQGANLEGAWLVGANMSGAWLLGATLEWSNLERTVLTGAHVDDQTKMQHARNAWLAVDLPSP